MLRPLCLRNRLLLAVICCPIYHWLEVSREVDISRARSAGDIFTDDRRTTSDDIGQQITCYQDSISILTHYEKASESFRCYGNES